MAHSEPIHLSIVNGCFHATTAVLSNCDNPTAHEAKNVYYVAPLKTVL